MKYDFDAVVERKGTFSCKWDLASHDDVLPMWVADMDFRTAPAITDALRKRVDHGVFGYTVASDEYYDAIIGWFGRRHGLRLEKEWILYTIGVVPALTAIVKALTGPGDKVLIQAPVYNCFFTSAGRNGCEAVSSDLIYKDGGYTMDFTDLEEKASDPAVKVMILCNPHNPVGRVWTEDELMQAGDICLRHGVTVIADEIHCEFTAPGHRYIPFASLSEAFAMHSVTCTSPSKAFNLAGLQVANMSIPDESLRGKVKEALKANEIETINPFGEAGLIAAYCQGEEWLDRLNTYIYDNYAYMSGFFRENLPQFPLLPLEGTYLAWVDCSIIGRPSAEVATVLEEKFHVWVNKGVMYGDAGDRFIRVNIACPRRLLSEGLSRLKEGLSYFL